MSDELHVKRRPVEGGGGGGAAAAKNRFAKKKALIQELDREQRLEENRNIDLGDVADDNGSGGDVKQEDVEEEEKEETIPTLVPIVKPKPTLSSWRRFLNPLLFLLTISVAFFLVAHLRRSPSYNGDCSLTQLCSEVKRLLSKLLTTTVMDVEDNRKYDSVDYTPELNDFIQRGGRQTP